MPVRLLSEDIILAIHADLIETYGGIHGLRDRNLLLSAIGRVETKLHYEPGVTIPALAAALGWGLIKNHVFLDGNKRIGLAAVVTFLAMNGYAFTLEAEIVKTMVLRAAASEITETEWSAWLGSATAPKPK